MDIRTAKSVILRTHVAALHLGRRASAIEEISGPGIGKSESVRQSCAELAQEIQRPVGLVPFMLATISSVDIRGFMLPMKSAAGALDTIFSTPPWFPVKANTQVVEPDGTWHKEGTWPDAMPDVGVLFLDEFGQAEDEVKKPAAELLLHGNVGNCALPIGWRVIAASNRMSDRSGVMRALMFVTNRRLELKIDASCPAWIAYQDNLPDDQRVHFLTQSFAMKQPHLVFRDAVPAGSDPFCTPRTLCLLDRDLMALRSPEDIKRDHLPTDPVAREVAAGWIGAGEAAQFFTHLKYADELPDIADIERDPMMAKLPPNKDAQMVAGFMLAHNVDAANAGNVMIYLGRLFIDMQVLAVNAISNNVARASALVDSRHYNQWLLKNQKLLIASRS